MTFKPGQSGNPAGRVKGSRNKISEDALKIIHAVLSEGDAVNSTAGLMLLRDTDPATFWRLIAGLFPKDVHVKGEHTITLLEESLSTTDAWIREINKQGADGKAKKPLLN